MRKIFFMALGLISFVSTFAQNEKYVTIEAEIANRISDTIQIRTQEKVFKTIKIDQKGIFKDTVKLASGIYFIFDGKGFSPLYLKNSYNLNIKFDAQKIKETIVFSGKGANENTYLIQNYISDSKYDYKSLLALKEAEFDTQLLAKKTADLKELESKKLDTEFVAFKKENIEKSANEIKKYHKKTSELNMMDGKISPLFEYDNHKGGKTNLEDLKGKFVYIDVWATWCGPCRAEIPALKKIEEKYRGKNIEFVSISIDPAKDRDKWQNFVTEKQMSGIQLIADKEWNSEFVKSYNITGIPRFILIDPTGKIIKGNAPRPSSPELGIELDALLK